MRPGHSILDAIVAVVMMTVKKKKKNRENQERSQCSREEGRVGGRAGWVGPACRPEAEGKCSTLL